MRLLKVLCCAIALAAFTTPATRADEFNKQTFLTFSAPVQVPGATLPAGTYMFKLADLQGNRHVVQIFDKEGTKLYTTILAIPGQRLEPTDKPVVMFSETPAGSPAAIKAWFYPGDTIGDEFVYPRREAMRIAAATHQPVLSRSDESTDMKSSEVARVDESGNPVNAEAKASGSRTPSTAPATETATTGQTAETNRNANRQPNASQNKPATTTTATTSDPTATQPAPRANRAKQPSASAQANQPTGTSGQANPNQAERRSGQLPKTASPLALYELVSGLAFAGALGVRQLRNRR